MSSERPKSPVSPTGEFVLAVQKDGDREALSLLVSRIHARLYRFCLYLTGNAQAAQDLCQDAYIKVIENIQTLEDAQHFTGWLFRVTRNVFLDRIRAPKNSRTVYFADLEEALAEGRERRFAAEMAQALSRLDEESRFLLLLICLEGRSYEEAAKIIGISTEAVRSRLYRLRQSLKGNFFTTETAA